MRDTVFSTVAVYVNVADENAGLSVPVLKASALRVASVDPDRVVPFTAILIERPVALCHLVLRALQESNSLAMLQPCEGVPSSLSEKVAEKRTLSLPVSFAPMML